jgi:hypothetical protein
MAFKPGRLPSKPGREASASSGNPCTGGVGSCATREGLHRRAARSECPGASYYDAEEWWSFDDAEEWSQDHHSAASSKDH